MCERLTDESRLDMLARLYSRTQMRSSLLQLRAEQAESRAIKAERIADRAIAELGCIDREAAMRIEMEEAVSP